MKNKIFILYMQYLRTISKKSLIYIFITFIILSFSLGSLTSAYVVMYIIKNREISDSGSDYINESQLDMIWHDYNVPAVTANDLNVIVYLDEDLCQKLQGNHSQYRHKEDLLMHTLHWDSFVRQHAIAAAMRSYPEAATLISFYLLTDQHRSVRAQAFIEIQNEYPKSPINEYSSQPYGLRYEDYEVIQAEMFKWLLEEGT